MISTEMAELSYSYFKFAELEVSCFEEILLYCLTSYFKIKWLFTDFSRRGVGSYCLFRIVLKEDSGAYIDEDFPEIYPDCQI